jgi:deoxycytidine triphosphate deaminase
MANYDQRHMWMPPAEDHGGLGVLLSDRIALYVDAVHLIEPEDFVEQDLRPASYDLHVGSEYYVNDQLRPLEHNEPLEIPANGLVYIATQERFNIPYYLIARYSLTVTQVYRGLLIDNGLHIDPGYHGRIYVPVHNLVDERRTLYRRDKLLSVDFTRTTLFAHTETQSIDSEEDLVTFANGGRLRGAAGKKIILFSSSLGDLKKSRTPPDFWKKYPGEKHKSSLLGIAERTRQELRRYRWTWIGTVFTILAGVLIGLLPWVVQLYVESHSREDRLEQRINDLERRLRAVPSIGGQRQTNQSGPPG